MAVGVYVLARTDSGVWVSVAVALGFAPYVLFSTSARVLADRHRRSTVLRWSIALRLVTGSATTVGLGGGRDLAAGSALAGGLSDAVGVTAALVLASLVTLALTAAFIPPLRSATTTARLGREPLHAAEDEA